MSSGDKSTRRDTLRKKKAAADRAREDRDGTTHLTLPHVVLDSEGWRRASHTAQALLLLVAYPLFLHGDLGGLPNGGLMVQYARLAQQGFRSRDVIASGLRDLIACGLLVETRKGGKHRPSLYAVTWLALSTNPIKYQDLDIDPSKWNSAHRGSYLRPDKPASQAQTGRTAMATVARRANAAARRDSPVPSHGREAPRLDRETVNSISAIEPSDGPVSGPMGTSPVPSDGISLEHCHLERTSAATSRAPATEICARRNDDGPAPQGGGIGASRRAFVVPADLRAGRRSE